MRKNLNLHFVCLHKSGFVPKRKNQICGELEVMDFENAFVRKEFIRVFDILVESNQSTGSRKQASNLEDYG